MKFIFSSLCYCLLFCGKPWGRLHTQKYRETAEQTIRDVAVVEPVIRSAQLWPHNNTNTNTRVEYLSFFPFGTSPLLFLKVSYLIIRLELIGIKIEILNSDYIYDLNARTVALLTAGCLAGRRRIALQLIYFGSCKLYFWRCMSVRN